VSFKKLETESSSPPVCMVDKAVSVLGPLEEWERKELQNSSSDFGDTCFNIADMKQTSIPRTMKWLKMSAEEGNDKGMFTYGGLLGLNPDLEYKRDEAAWWVKRVKDDELVAKVGSVDSDGSQSRRFITRLLLSGSLSKNQDSVLYRSFFCSGLREVHLLPLLSKYLVEEKKREEEKRNESLTLLRFSITSLTNISYLIYNNTSYFGDFTFYLSYDNQYMCFLPLLFSLFPNVTSLSVSSTSRSDQKHFDLSVLQQVDTSKLERLGVFNCSYDSLSPLSLCNLSSLHGLAVHGFPDGRDGFHPLNGLSSDITKSLKTLGLTSCHLKDLSPLSGFDLSFLETLNLYGNPDLSSLSPLRGSDLYSLQSLTLDRTNISDLSPLCECKGLALEELQLSDTPIEDLSPLSLLDLSRLKKPIMLEMTKVSDLSPLLNFSYDGVEVDISDTPAEKKMEEDGLKSPQMIGKVMVKWSLSFSY